MDDSMPLRLLHLTQRYYDKFRNATGKTVSMELLREKRPTFSLLPCVPTQTVENVSRRSHIAPLNPVQEGLIAPSWDSAEVSTEREPGRSVHHYSMIRRTAFLTRPSLPQSGQASRISYGKELLQCLF
jgi:hypothetical protein